MPRSCPPLRSDEVGWHGRRVRTRHRLILERVFWFVNRCLSQMFVGVPDRGRGWRKGGVWEWVCSLISGVEVVSMPRPWGPGLRRGDGGKRGRRVWVSDGGRFFD